MKRLYGAAVALAACAAMFAGSAIASAETVYDNTPTPQPGNLPSVGYEANAITEYGGQIQLAGTARTNATISVLMSTWGCQAGHWYSGDCTTTPGATFSHPITVNVYAVGAGNTVGSLLVSQSKTFNIPYRPSADNLNCTGGRWYDGTTCFNGKAVNLAFNPLSVTLPNKVIVSLAYNTSHYGTAPIGESATCYSSPGGCGYDSLNVGVAYPPTVGSVPNPSDEYLNSLYSGVYCDGGTPGSFRLDTGCSSPDQPTIQVDAPIGPPTNKDQCKDDGWKAFDTPRKFKNQGDCVSYVATGGKNGKRSRH